MEIMSSFIPHCLVVVDWRIGHYEHIPK